ncbi:hypothetical protein G7Z17_g7311 [Cylindrodendrum hubeiense]|uniref:Ribosomal RNA methyltransferase FtsJ domain-containing protein n=1 Tax=Cylindrodendrum hubeiense TaxID=595255 RepID=A0A9P5H368_9HYPO|nr:hypothetical protein G7Z17_g7311 [Cylindrodendrum hubeiense]
MSSDTDLASHSSPHSDNMGINPTDETGQQHRDDQQDADGNSFEDAGAHNKIREYMEERSREFRRLQEIRAKGWKSEKGDEYFQRQRRSADNASNNTANYFYGMMQKIGTELHRITKAFELSHISNQPAILDMCMAPGGFVASVLKKYPDAHVKAMSLPVERGGHEVLLKAENLEVEFLDVTMLAGDMGITKEDIPVSHPDRDAFTIQRIFSAQEKFDLAFCDGQVLRTQQRSQWREPFEAYRLTKSQLALSLEHLKPGGTMVILLHKLEAWGSVKLLHTLSKFSNLKLFKHHRHHAMRSSFYAVAKNVQSDGELALEAIAEWKRAWKNASLGTKDERTRELKADSADAQEVLDDFGKTLVNMGRIIWTKQADALERASFMEASKGG